MPSSSSRVRSPSRSRPRLACALLALSLAAGGGTAAAASPLERGIAAYESHIDDVDLEAISVPPEPFDTAIKHLKVAVADAASREEAGRYLLHAFYLKGTYAVEHRDQKRSVFSQGREYARRLTQTYPANAELVLLYAANLGRWGQAHGILRAAREGVAGRLRELARRAADLDEAAGGGGAYRLLAQVHYQTPKIPLLLSWPSQDEALGYLQKAVEIAPHHPANNALYGRYLHESGQEAEGLRYLRQASRMAPRRAPRFLLEDARYIRMAQDALREIANR